MRNLLLKNLLDPLLRRLGTMGGAALVAYSVPSDTINTIVAGGIAAAGLVLDLTLSASERRANGGK